MTEWEPTDEMKALMTESKTSLMGRVLGARASRELLARRIAELEAEIRDLHDAGMDASNDVVYYRDRALEAERERDEARAEAERLRVALQAIVDAGTWYGSALEIDVYKAGVPNGEELERMAREALGAEDTDSHS